eukprot:gnl/TRDRNA2_/TRDRNA2_85115_c0_seq3.p1 gnl/TRDRNA2_/TRDRNA2_85115_c0~~gnl/TRDRNA2_/TRDRNA2_85115_c0_seq3.p1  ORF type:complete len:610 (-),score=92.14 gnl/TRDRNA2_/TRDRNA2_85115_c0_seq3:61-1782(-)
MSGESSDEESEGRGASVSGRVSSHGSPKASAGGSSHHGSRAQAATTDGGSTDGTGGAVNSTVGIQPSATGVTDKESRRMRLLSCPFVESIDLTLVPASSRTMLKPPAEGSFSAGSPRPSHPAYSSAKKASAGEEEKMLGLKQLRTLITEVYTAKKVDDQRRDKSHQARRPLHIVLQEFMRRQHGIKKVTHQKSWLLVESVVHYTGTDRGVSTFSDFLDGSRDLDELSFYLYCTAIVNSSISEESHGLQPTRVPEGEVSFTKGTRIVELLFADLPKSLMVAKAELEKCTRMRTAGSMSDLSEMFDFSFTEMSRCVPADDLYEILLEGWRMSALLLEQTVPSFSWRRSVLSFIQADVHQRGWLVPNEVLEIERQRLLISDAANLRVLDQTSLGAFVFRAVHRCHARDPEEPPAGQSAGGAASLLCRSSAKRAKQAAMEECLKVGQKAFDSLDKILGTYLTWLMHSEDLRDLAVYHAVKARIYGFRQASAASEAGPGAHQLRCLLLLLLAHQFDVQLQQGDFSPEHLHWEIQSLLQLLRESWRRGAASESGAEFGPELELLGADGAPMESVESREA